MIHLNDSKNIRLGAILSYVALGISIVGSLFVSNRVLNYIGDYNYGLYSFVNSITSWLTIVSSALTASFLRFATIESKDNDGKSDNVNTIYLKLLSLLCIGVVVIGFGLIAFLFFNNIRIGNYSWEDSRFMYLLFALSVFNIGLTMPTAIFSLYISFKKKFVFAKLLYIFTIIITFAGHFLIAYFTKNVVLIAVFTIFVTLFNFLINSIYSRKMLNISFAKTTLKNNPSLVKGIIIFSSILLLNTIVDEINTEVDKTLLGFFSIPEDITKYQMAQQLARYLTVMSVAVSGVYAPTIYELVIKEERESLNSVYLRISKIQSIVLCCIAFGFLTCGKDFILWWLGDERIASYYVGVALMIISIGPLTMNASIEIQRAMNKHKFRGWVYFIFAILNVGLSILFLCIFDREYAVYSCLAGTVISRIGSHWIAMNIYNKKSICLPVERYLLVLVSYMTIGVIAFVAVLFFNQLFIINISSHLFRFLIQGSIFTFIYLLICFIVNRKMFFSYFKNLPKKE